MKNHMINNLIDILKPNYIFYLLVVRNSIFVNSDFGVQRCERENEFYSCGSGCQNTCRTLLETCSIINIRCNDLCYCMPGFARDDRLCEKNITCIPEWQCDSPKGRCLGQNEEFLPNGSPCQTTCARLELPCPIFNKSSLPSCHCKKGYARDENGVCVPRCKCPKGRCEDLYEVYMSFNCQKDCYNLGGCASTETMTLTGCHCQTGYVRGAGGHCIPEWQCYL